MSSEMILVVEKGGTNKWVADTIFTTVEDLEYYLQGYIRKECYRIMDDGVWCTVDGLRVAENEYNADDQFEWGFYDDELEEKYCYSMLHDTDCE